MLNLTEKQETFSKQLPKNLMANISSFLVSVLIGLFLAPYFIDTLGVASYALIPLATSMTNYVNMVIQSLNISVSRYLTIDLQKRDFRKANITFNTAIFGTFGIILLMLPAVIFISYYAPSFFEIPANQRFDAILLFLGVFGAFLVRMWSSNFGVSLFAYNRLDLRNFVSIINILVQVSLIVIFFQIFPPKLWHIGFSYLIGALTAFAATIIFSRKITPQLKISFHDFRKSEVKNITGTGGWIIINQIGALLFLQVDLIIVNKLFGTTAGGEYSIVLMWSILLRSIAGMLGGVISPIIFTYYAKKMFDEIIDISKSAVKFMGLAIAFPVGYICGFAPNILSVWVGPEFIKLSPLMIVLLAPLVINLSVLPLFNINVSFNKVRFPGLVTLFMGAGNVLLAITLSYLTGWGYYGVAVAGAIMLTLKNTFFIPWYATRVLGIPQKTFITSMLPGVLAMLITAGVAGLISHYLNISDLFSLIVCGFVLGILYLCIVWIVGINQSERKIVESFIPSTIRSRIQIECHR